MEQLDRNVDSHISPPSLSLSLSPQQYSNAFPCPLVKTLDLDSPPAEVGSLSSLGILSCSISQSSSVCSGIHVNGGGAGGGIINRGGNRNPRPSSASRARSMQGSRQNSTSPQRSQDVASAAEVVGVASFRQNSLPTTATNGGGGCGCGSKSRTPSSRGSPSPSRSPPSMAAAAGLGSVFPVPSLPQAATAPTQPQPPKLNYARSIYSKTHKLRRQVLRSRHN